MKKRNVSIVGSILLGVVFVLVPSATPAFDEREAKTPLQQKQFFKDDMRIGTSNDRIDIGVVRARTGDPAVDRFVGDHGPGFVFYTDPRSGTLSALVGRVPMVPGNGAGNVKTIDDVRRDLGRPVTDVGSREVGDLVRSFVVDNSELIGVRPQQMGATRAKRVGDHLWQVSIPQEVDGIPVRHGRLAATISHGNLVLVGAETWAEVKIDTEPAITDLQAMSIGFNYAEGKSPADKIFKKPELEIVPYAPQEFQDGDRFAGPVGSGYGHRLVWVFGFRRPPAIESWEVMVDARTGELIAFEDVNHYTSEQMVGGVYPLTSTEICPTDDTCGTMQSDYPMPYADTGQAAPDDYTNAAGIYEYTGGTATTSLNGLYVRVSDNCGAISESTTDGPLDLGGVNGEHDCTTAGASAGDTPASRTCFYELNKLIEVARGWLPDNTWLQSQLPANVNISDTCNAFYDYSSVNFFQSGGGCRNTGELAAVFDHEWGHGMDDNDAAGSMSSTSEAYADIAAIYRLQASCVGHGFWHTYDRGCGMTADGTGFNANESKTGVHCDLDCSGVRDADWDKHEDHAPDTPQNFNCVHCDSGSGPCGKQVHCSAAPSRQAAWDLVARDLQAPPFDYDRTTAFIIGNKLFYQGSGNIGSWHACTCPDTADGCGATNAYMQWLAVDDDNGDLTDGTPHMTAIYSAFARHNIACDTPVPTDSGCAGGPTEAPDLTVDVGSNQLHLTWTAVAGAVEYRVFRTEGHAGCDLGKALIATVPGTSYTDLDVANERPYSYVVQAVGTSGACFSPASDCRTVTPLPCAGSIGLDKLVVNCDDSFTMELVDSDLVGGGTHQVSVRSQTEPTAETVTLAESPAGSGHFIGTVPTTDGAASTGDGAISVSHGDMVTVEYVDLSFCGTPDVSVERAVPVDCVAPAIVNVRAVNVTGHSADILWDTDEVSDSGVIYDLVSPPVSGLSTDPDLVAGHFVHLTGLDECSTYYYYVQSADVAGNAIADTAAGGYYGFETGKNVNPTYPTVDPPVSIPDSDPVGAESTIVVTDTEAIEDVNVVVNITHTYTGDLMVSLIGPDDTEVVLANRRGGGGNDFTDTVFDDESAAPISSGAAPFTGSFQPDDPLAAFDGKIATGTWRLRVEDMAGADLGTIDSWSLELIYPAQACGPNLKYQSHDTSDSCSGTGVGGDNGIVESGEDVLLPVMLRNNGTDPTSGIIARVTTSTPGVTVTRSITGYPDLLAGESAPALSDPFAFTVDMSVACGTVIEFTVEAFANEGTWTDSFAVRVGTPGFGTGTVDSVDVPHPINDSTTFTSTVDVTDAATVSDVDVGLTLTHTYDGDLDIFLIGPEGTRVELTSDNGGTGENFTDTIFDDEAATSITDGSAPFTGSYRPEGTLAALDGISAAGTWTLEVTDDAGADQGELLAWSLVLTTETGPLCETCTVAVPGVVPWLEWMPGGTTGLEWATVPDATFYSLYEGALADLPALVDGASDSCRRMATVPPSTGETLSEDPAPGVLRWYLVRAGSAGGEGPAGDGSDGPRVLDSSGDCP